MCGLIRFRLCVLFATTPTVCCVDGFVVYVYFFSSVYWFFLTFIAFFFLQRQRHTMRRSKRTARQSLSHGHVLLSICLISVCCSSGGNLIGQQSLFSFFFVNHQCLQNE